MIQRLKNEIESVLKRKMLTPKDFDYLSECIFSRLHIVISSTTLKRLWGYIDEPVKPRQSTLSFLSQFLGYKDYIHFEASCRNSEDISSLHVVGRKINVKDELTPGDRLQLSWAPDRVCVVEYIEDFRFKVLESAATRLTPGDVFECMYIIEGEPLYLDNLIQNGGKPVGYVCGKNGGVRFVKL